MRYFTLESFDLRGKRVFVRVDINSPIDPKTGEIMDDSRIKACMDTLSHLHNSKVIMIAHQGRPGDIDCISLEKHAKILERYLEKEVKFTGGVIDKATLREIENLRVGEILLLENIRFYAEEMLLKENEMDKSYILHRLLPYVDYYVNDAFSAAHRAQLSLVAFAKYRPMLAGKLMEREIEGIRKFFEIDARPKVLILGGSKIEDSIKVTKNMLDKNLVDYVITGGVVSTVFLKSAGVKIGRVNEEFLKNSYKDLEKYLSIVDSILSNHREKIVLPSDVVININNSPTVVDVDEIEKYNGPIWDIGPKTVETYRELIDIAAVIGMNGPMGVYEIEGFERGTKEIFECVSRSKAYKIVGGGHTISVLNKYGLIEKIDHVSLAGGALITYLSGERMPVLEALEESYRIFGGAKNESKSV